MLFSVSMVQAHAHELLNQKNTAPAHPLLAATERLVQALDRLETRLQQAKPAHAHEHKRREELVLVVRENESLRQEREDLNGAIVELQQQYDDLHQVAGAIYNKLDDSIKRLTQILDA